MADLPPSPRSSNSSSSNNNNNNTAGTDPKHCNAQDDARPQRRRSRPASRARERRSLHKNTSNKAPLESPSSSSSSSSHSRTTRPQESSKGSAEQSCWVRPSYDPIAALLRPDARPHPGTYTDTDDSEAASAEGEVEDERGPHDRNATPSPVPDDTSLLRARHSSTGTAQDTQKGSPRRAARKSSSSSSSSSNGGHTRNPQQQRRHASRIASIASTASEDAVEEEMHAGSDDDEGEGVDAGGAITAGDEAPLSPQERRDLEQLSCVGGCTTTIQGHDDAVNAVVVLRSGLIASGGDDGVVRVWDPKSQRRVYTLGPHDGAVECIAEVFPSTLSPNTAHASGEVGCGRGVGGGGGGGGGAQQSAAMVAVGVEEHVVIWSIPSQSLLCRFQAHCAYIWAMTWLFPGPKGAGLLTQHKVDSGVLVTASADRTIKLWRVEPKARFDKATCVSTLEGHRDSVYGVAALSSGQLVSGSTDTTVMVWSPFESASTRTLHGHTALVYDVCALADTRIASASMDTSIRVWCVRNGACLLTLNGHTDAVTSLAPLSRHVFFSGSRDGQIRVWNAEDGTCARVFEGVDEGVNALATLSGSCNADRVLASAYDDGAVRFWGIAVRLAGQ
ncbi:hypothetical protein PTSG_12135 [Salpingoeca rosetta]|uniref:Uncharacterized protein n=1 Tax=Salpingoeca rosetta (strain ATCC 50818 / BSB-021) TaxID=946362 RepID=F2U6R7_SALR5|nr:uncharacterized protein PTSG_12135 [Salpingoeca rosetta]EGD83549.1 hypothetical protein PTSG_12135 [Salpingoeca rosetta]|eukprot:XP_004995053.1 hypothetical protein PTSG_12135 [Salpingoeca rosetta]